jgi:hypothetical protein
MALTPVRARHQVSRAHGAIIQPTANYRVCQKASKSRLMTTAGATKNPARGGPRTGPWSTLKTAPGGLPEHEPSIDSQFPRRFLSKPHAPPPVRACIPTRGTKVPIGPDWIHEIKHDGYRMIVQRDGKRVRLTRSSWSIGKPCCRASPACQFRRAAFPEIPKLCSCANNFHGNFADRRVDWESCGYHAYLTTPLPA